MNVEPPPYISPSKRYRKTGEDLGHGAYGFVTKRIDTQTNMEVAIKRFKQPTTRSEYSLEILREMRYLRELDHENIVKCLDFYFHHHNLYMVMEFHPSDLKQIIGTLRFVPEKIRKYTRMILEGLNCLHSNFLLHRVCSPRP